MTIADTEQINHDQASSEYELPEGWDILPLGNCIDILDNLRIPVNSELRNKRHGPIPYYGATGQIGWIDDFLFDEELLLLGEDGAPFLDKTKPIAYIITGKSWVNNHAHVLRAIQVLTTNQFLKYYLDTFEFADFVTGTTRLKLTQGVMRKIPVLLPPLPEQRRIVAKVEELLTRVNVTKDRLAKVSLILKRFRQSVLAAACSGRLTEAWRMANGDTDNHNWVAVDFFDFCVLQRGYDLPISKRLDGPYPIVTSGGIIAYHAQCKMSGPGVLVGRSGSIGKVFYVESDFPSVPHNTTLYIKNFKGNLPKYVYYFLLGFDFQQFGASTAVPTLNRNNLRNTLVEVPPVEEQREIVRRVEALFGLADVIEKRVAVATAPADKLTQAILTKAFRGELVPIEVELARREGRSYEPASELLARIKFEQEAIKKSAPHHLRRVRQRETI
jgi:type I restriction enzyme S subunit